ncbi:MAG: SDR family oxidoreductase [Gemmatimonadota bacterium]
MRILIIGGTRFLGRHLVAAALAAGHQVTLFNRGLSAPDLYPEVEQLHGNRDGDLKSLADRTWDAVVDTCGYVPRVVQQSVDALSHRTKRYLFVSSISVYRDPSRAGVAEDAPLAELSAPTSEDVVASYGALKAACERVVCDVFAERSLVVRPGLIVGPHDPTNRFSYWVRRCARGGAVLLPGVPDYPVQFIDAHDLASWMIDLLQCEISGTFNAVGPRQPLTLSGFISRCAHALGTSVRPVWVAREFLRQHAVQPWTDLPLWAGEEAAGFAQISGERGWSAGLCHRSLEDTVRDTWRWCSSRADGGPAGGLAEAREAALLALWSQLPH